MEAREALAAALLETFEPREAYRHYQWLASRQPESISYLLGKARSLRDLGEMAKARQVLDDLLAKHPQEEMALGELGQLAWREGRAAEAEKWLKKALAIYPYHLKNLYTLYLSLKAQNRTRQAQQYYARYKRVAADVARLDFLSLKKITKEPHNPDIPYEIGVICMRNATAEVGVSWLKKALELNPWHQGANEALARYYSKIGNRQLAAK
jgi:tetratricopeptide (TPR) repeat protein